MTQGEHVSVGICPRRFFMERLEYNALYNQIPIDVVFNHHWLYSNTEVPIWHDLDNFDVLYPEETDFVKCALSSYATHRIPHRSQGANSSAFITDLNSRSRDSTNA